MMKRIIVIAILLAGGMMGQAQVLSLRGSWQVRLDSADRSQSVSLPGTLDDAGIGERNEMPAALNAGVLAHLARKVQYVGKAWYSRKFRVPAGWAGREVQLVLERVLWRSRVSIDGRDIGQEQESLSAPHVFDLTAYVLPGKEQTITLCIDNGNIYPGINSYSTHYPQVQSREMAHAYTNHTQIKWNGVLGEIGLRARPAVSIRHVAIFPDRAAGQIRFRVDLAGATALEKGIRVSATVIDMRTGAAWQKGFGSEVHANAAEGSIPAPAGVKSWDEFDPALYKLVTVVQTARGRDTVVSRFGIRDIGIKDSALMLNGHRIFVRGNLECVIFPKKGYPPTSIGEWRDLIRTAKSYGLNTFRFHSWCPPEEAFAAADETGFYIHVELPQWSLQTGRDSAASRFLTAEAARILQHYGNHPSFLFFSMGNELEGELSFLNGLVKDLKQQDRRHLYATTTFSFQKGGAWEPQTEDDIFITQWTKKGWVRGQGIFNDVSPAFEADYSQAISDISIPVISHEIGQYSVYPDISEIGEYTGNLVPKNFIAVREDLKKKGMLYLAPEYLKASGSLAAILYKEEIERALKTRGFDGFHLLQLQDFPGQGTALVGLLNAFWKSKGVITPAAFRQFCNEVVPLIRYPRAVYTNTDTFEASVELANFYRPLPGAVLVWTIRDGAGAVLEKGEVAKRDFPIGNGLNAGKIVYPLDGIHRADRLTVEVSLAGTGYRNSWHIWVYPASLPEDRGDVLVTRDLSEGLAGLQAGRKVLLCPDPDSLQGITGKFVPVFWSPVHFANQPGTMGLLIKQDHKALLNFPTASHSDWQWWDLAIHSKTLETGSLPEEAIIVRVIDNFVRNSKLANLFEVRMGKGRLLFCAIDVVKDLAGRPQARQLRYSLLKYMNSDAFNPVTGMTTDQLKGFFK